MRADEGMRLEGYDGYSRALRGTPFVPEGPVVWEMGTSDDPKGKADEDLAEGIVLSPHLADPARSVWLVPSNDFQARHRADPERRTEPMEAVIAVANARSIPIVVVDGSRSVAELVVEVEVRLADALNAGPTATTISERRELLREPNLDVVRQIRAGCVRSWATADAEVQVRTFTCECGDEACAADVDATVGYAAANRVVARGHRSS